MSIAAESIIKAPRSDLNQVLTEFTEDELAIRRMNSASSGKEQTFEIRTDKGETLQRLHEACVEHEIGLDIRRLSPVAQSSTN